jgi:AAA domain-containing protein
MPHPSASPGPIIAVEGISGAGKSTLVRALARRASATGIAEAWVRLRPQPALESRSRAALRCLELRLLEEERARARLARTFSDTGGTVWLDTGFVGPVTYERSLAALSPSRWGVGQPLLPRGESTIYLPDLTVYLDPPPVELLRRALHSEDTHNQFLVARHLTVGLVEREFWLREFRAAFPGRLVQVRDPGSATLLARSGEDWRSRARAAGRPAEKERLRFLRLLARPGRLPYHLSGGANNR